MDVTNGFISRELYRPGRHLKDELSKVFTSAWLLVGHESLVSNPCDFFTSRMGEESVILCRDKKGEIDVFFNSCRHRGMKVCRYEQGVRFGDGAYIEVVRHFAVHMPLSQLDRHH